MNKVKNEKLIFENYENEFSFKKSKSNLNITFNRIAFIFFIFLMISLIYSIKLMYLGSLNSKININEDIPIKANYRADIVDRNENFLVKTVNTIDVGINPNFVINKKNY